MQSKEGRGVGGESGGFRLNLDLMGRTTGNWVDTLEGACSWDCATIDRSKRDTVGPTTGQDFAHVVQ